MTQKEILLGIAESAAQKFRVAHYEVNWEKGTLGETSPRCYHQALGMVKALERFGVQYSFTFSPKQHYMMYFNVKFTDGIVQIPVCAENKFFEWVE